MSLTSAEIDEIIRAARGTSTKRSRRSGELREFLLTLDDYRFGLQRAPPLVMLCRAGADHSWRRIEKETNPKLLAGLSPRAKASLKRHLQKTLEKITRPTLELEWTSFILAVTSLGFPGTEHSPATIRMFLRESPAHRLGQLFKSFPLLADLWAVATRQWRTHVREILVRLRRDRTAILSLCDDTSFPAKIEDLRLGLSDPHQDGRSVALIQLSGGRRVIYKPRSGANESAWFSFLGWMNRGGFQPKLRLLRVLERKSYCWMEYAEATGCSKTAEVRRFYERLGGLIAAAYFLKAVDCHRENLIAAGEHPVLVDVDALWHVSPTTRRQSASDVLYSTGFFPNAKRLSLQSQSSCLGGGLRGAHLPRLGDRPVAPALHAKEIILGVRRAWRCVMRDARRRAAFLRTLRRMRALERRWIYCATARYATILRASLRPAVLRSKAERDALISAACSRAEGSKTVVRVEAKALGDLNIPYFTRRTREPMPHEPNRPPAELIRAIRQSLE